MKLTQKTLTILFLAIAVFTLFNKVNAYDDEDDELGEILFDVMTGVLVGVCQEFHTCNIILNILTMTTLLFICIGMCVGFIKKQDICNRRVGVRTLRTAGGYHAYRAFT